ncbi:MAG: glycosyltransferase family 1 protein, partial [Flavobacteriaceae bacterium]|nr:glycosyltransferase family 1 protein [Flavobacteriaceae bacterium]
YGDHCRDLMKSLRKMDKYDIKIIPLRWGNTPQNQVDGESEFGRWMLERVIGEIGEKPDIFMQVSVANEFEPKGHYNIGVTAGVETTIAPKDFIDGSNKMDLIIVPSEFTKGNIGGTVYQQKDQNSGQIVGEIKVEKPIEVLFEGVDTEVFSKGNGTDVLANVKEDFCFLVVGHWLKGNLGQDRKDIGMAIKTFATVFQYLPKDKRPALLVKTSHAGFSVIDRETTRQKIDEVLKTYGDKCPSIYLIHGDLEETDMSNLYHHPKVKAMLSFTKGEGYGRPLAEFTLTGKPIIVSGWSGHMDFLPMENTVFLEGSLTNVDESAADQFLMKEAQWFTVNYSNAANKIYDVYNKYKTYLEKSQGLKENTIKNFSLDKMHERFTEILDTYVKKAPKLVPFNLPK